MARSLDFQSLLMLLVLSLVNVVNSNVASSSNTVPCTDPSFHCLVCQPQGTCSQCSNGYFMINYTQPCLRCSDIEGCYFCNNFFGCAQCNDSYLHVQMGALWGCFRNNTCKEPSYNCKVCHTNGCDQCNDGYYKMDYTKPCIPCSSIPGCNGLCNDFFGCGQCQNGYTLTMGENNTHICELTRTKCRCTSPVANPNCPYSYKASCYPVSVLPSSAASLDPLDCSLWEWITSCDQTCDSSHGCDNITKPSVNCTKPQYTCTTDHEGNCAWDYICKDIVTVECLGSMCNCDFETPYIGCAGGVLPMCECAPNPLGQCVTSMKCPQENKTVNCVQDLCLNCYDQSSSSPICNTQSPDPCLAQCIAFTKCAAQNNTCDYSKTPMFKSCLSGCNVPNRPSSPSSPTECLSASLCECLSIPNCVYLLFQSSFTVHDEGSTTEMVVLSDVNYNYGRCISPTELATYVNDYAAGAITSNTPGVRAMCFNQSETPTAAEHSECGNLTTELLNRVTANSIVQSFQDTLASVLTNEERQALQGVPIVLSDLVPPSQDTNISNIIHVSLVVTIMSASRFDDISMLATVIQNTLSALFTIKNIEVKVDVFLSKVATPSISGTKRSTHEQVSSVSYLVQSIIEVSAASPLTPSSDSGGGGGGGGGGNTTDTDTTTPVATPSIPNTTTDNPSTGELSSPNFGGQSSSSGASVHETSQDNNVGIIVGVVMLLVIILLVGLIVYMVVILKRHKREERRERREENTYVE